MSRDRTFWRVLGAAVAFCAAVLWFFPALPFALPAVCPVRAVLGLPCPGCGMTRATALLLDGDLTGSLAAHALAIPILALLAGLLMGRMGFLGSGLPPRGATRSAAGCLAVLLGYHAWRLGTLAANGALGESLQAGVAYRIASWALGLF